MLRHVDLGRLSWLVLRFRDRIPHRQNPIEKVAMMNDFVFVKVRFLYSTENRNAKSIECLPIQLTKASRRVSLSSNSKIRRAS